MKKRPISLSTAVLTPVVLGLLIVVVVPLSAATAQERDGHSHDDKHDDEQRKTPFRDGGVRRSTDERRDHVPHEGPDTENGLTVPEDRIVKWDPWEDTPPLQGDFSEMIYQVAEEIEWLQFSDDRLLAPEFRSELSEAKSNLEIDCELCDDDPEFFVATENTQKSVRNVPAQLKTFQKRISQSLRHPTLQELRRKIEPIRADKSKLVGLIDSLDKKTTAELYHMLAVETLKRRADNLVTYSDLVTRGTFSPVKLDGRIEELQVGDQALNFNVTTIKGKTVSLDSYSGKRLILVFSGGYACPVSMKQVEQLIDVNPQLNQLNAECLIVFREQRSERADEADLERLRQLERISNSPFSWSTDFSYRDTEPYSRNGSFSTYVIGVDQKIGAELKGVRYIRPSGEAIVEAVAKIRD